MRTYRVVLRAFGTTRKPRYASIHLKLRGTSVRNPSPGLTWLSTRPIVQSNGGLSSIQLGLSVSVSFLGELHVTNIETTRESDTTNTHRIAFTKALDDEYCRVILKFTETATGDHKTPDKEWIRNPKPIGKAAAKEQENAQTSVSIQDLDVTSMSNVVQLRAASQEYLVLPGNYSGDAWATAGCLLVDERIKVIIPSKPAGNGATPSIFHSITQQFTDFCGVLDEPGSRQIRDRAIRRDNLNGNQVAESQVANAASREIRKQENADGRPDSNPHVGWTFATTSLLMAYAEEKGTAELLDMFDFFVEREVDELDEQYLPRDYYPKKKVEPMEARLQWLRDKDMDYRNVLLINMRIGRSGNHPQHDISPAIYAQIVSAAYDAGLQVVRIGGYQDEQNTPGGGWMQNLAEPVMALFVPGQRLRRSETSYFWSEIAAMDHVVGIVGGRSGSLDVTSFMGMRTLCWDVVDVDDHEYARQFLYYPIQSLIARHDARTGKSYDNKIKTKKTPCPGLLHQHALAAFLAGDHVVPDHSSDKFPASIMCMVPRLDELTGRNSAQHRQRIMMRALDYMTPFIARGDNDTDDDDDDDDLENNNENGLNESNDIDDDELGDDNEDGSSDSNGVDDAMNGDNDGNSSQNSDIAITAAAQDDGTCTICDGSDNLHYYECRAPNCNSGVHVGRGSACQRLYFKVRDETPRDSSSSDWDHGNRCRRHLIADGATEAQLAQAALSGAACKYRTDEAS